jgi:hypothetical protein
MKVIEVVGRAVMGIKKIGDKLPYKQFLADGVTESKMWKQDYYRYRYNGIVFIVNANDEFTEQYDSKQLYSVTLIQDTDNTLQFDFATTLQQEIDFKRGEVTLECITVDSFKRDFSNVAEII